MISDTHGLHDQLNLPTDCDVLVHSGDLLNRGKLSELNNASVVNEAYEVVNKPWIVEI